jgi:tRNA (adenine57-N1/adenine58-N1)-methyltransferase
MGERETSAKKIRRVRRELHVAPDDLAAREDVATPEDD